jgi:lysyl oxidase
MIQRPACRFVLIALSLAIASLRGSVATAQVAELLPNLEPFSASEVQLVSGPNGLELRFSTTSWNRGAGPMELMGGDVTNPGTPENPGDQEVIQNIYRTDGSVRQKVVGVFEYHGGTHSHFHFENYARYTLQPVNVQGTVGNGAKVSFCLLDNAKINTRLPNAAKHPIYQTCNPDIQGISVGWGDTYRYYLDGQSVPFGNNPSGDYLLIIEVNPQRQLEESNYSDNTACALVRVDVSALTTNVIGTSCNSSSSVTITEIVPNSIRAGSTGGVVIHGSGFATGMSVTFENGSGKTPIASIQTLTNDTITATVTVPSGGSSADPVWDLRVGPTMKPDAFTVAR